MRYVGIHGLSSNFAIAHDTPMILLSIAIAIITAYGGLRAFLARHDGVRLILSSIAFGVGGIYEHALHCDAPGVQLSRCRRRPIVMPEGWRRRSKCWR